MHIEYPQLRKLDNVMRFEWPQEMCQEAGVFCLPYNARERVQGENHMTQVIWPYNEGGFLARIIRLETNTRLSEYRN